MIVNKKNKCNRCGSDLRLISGDYGPFWGCTEYPDCKYTEDVKKSNKEFRKKYGEHPRELGESLYSVNGNDNIGKSEYNYKKGYVYVIYFKYQDYYKIGYSINPNDRIISLTKRNKIPKNEIDNKYEYVFDNMEIVCLLETYNYKTLEKQLHFLFKDKLIYKNEYFDLNNNDIRSIKNIRNICGINVDMIEDFTLNVKKGNII